MFSCRRTCHRYSVKPITGLGFYQNHFHEKRFWRYTIRVPRAWWVLEPGDAELLRWNTVPWEAVQENEMTLKLSGNTEKAPWGQSWSFTAAVSIRYCIWYYWDLVHSCGKCLPLGMGEVLRFSVESALMGMPRLHSWCSEKELDIFTQWIDMRSVTWEWTKWSHLIY